MKKITFEVSPDTAKWHAEKSGLPFPEKGADALYFVTFDYETEKVIEIF